jgi:hypothetical protein
MFGKVTVKVLHKGQRLDAKFLNEHPEIQTMYPTKNEFNNIYLPLLNDSQSTGANYLLEISENSVKVFFNLIKVAR